jgi:MOSC domain-containing protein YiiM
MAMVERIPGEQTDPQWSGQVAGIYIGPVAGQPLEAVDQVRAVKGRGLEGDRYFLRTGTYSELPGTGREVTLIEAEAIDAAARDYGVQLAPGDARRNLLTAGVPLNHLVGREFFVGQARLRGMRLCEPCGHLAKLTRRPVVKTLSHRGGLRAEIVEGGTIRQGDPIRPAEASG